MTLLLVALTYCLYCPKLSLSHQEDVVVGHILDTNLDHWSAALFQSQECFKGFQSIRVLWIDRWFKQHDTILLRTWCFYLTLDLHDSMFWHIDMVFCHLNTILTCTLSGHQVNECSDFTSPQTWKGASNSLVQEPFAPITLPTCFILFHYLLNYVVANDRLGQLLSF